MPEFQEASIPRSAKRCPPSWWAEAGLVSCWLVCLAAILTYPRLEHSSSLGDDLTRNTVRLSLAAYALGASLMLVAGPEEWEAAKDRVRLARWCWTLAWAAYLVHLAMAFHYYHQWSHAAAVAHTRAVSGVGAGIYVSHLFTVLWTLDVAWWWFGPKSRTTRPSWVGRVLYGFMAFIVFNATVVYERGVIRSCGLTLFTELAILYVYRTARKSSSGPAQGGARPLV